MSTKLRRTGAESRTESTTPEFAGGAFTGFGAGAFKFLRALSDNQTREWFQARKADYEAQIRDPMAHLVIELARELPRRGIPLRGDPKRSVFRINRDIRFSNDKRPYKTHVSAALTREGEKMSPGVLYVHVDPEGSFAAAGFFQPQPDVLRAIRNRVASGQEDFRRVLEELASKGLTLVADENALKRVPRGFESVQEADLVDVLRRNSLIVRRALSQKVLRDAGLVTFLADFAEASAPLLQFGWEAMTALKVVSSNDVRQVSGPKTRERLARSEVDA